MGQALFCSREDDDFPMASGALDIKQTPKMIDHRQNLLMKKQLIKREIESQESVDVRQRNIKAINKDQLTSQMDESLPSVDLRKPYCRPQTTNVDLQMQKIKKLNVTNTKPNPKFNSKMQYRTPDDRELVNPLEIVQRQKKQSSKPQNQVPGRKLRLNYHKCLNDHVSLDSDDESDKKVTIQRKQTTKIPAQRKAPMFINGQLKIASANLDTESDQMSLQKYPIFDNKENCRINCATNFVKRGYKTAANSPNKHQFQEQSEASKNTVCNDNWDDGMTQDTKSMNRMANQFVNHAKLLKQKDKINPIQCKESKYVMATESDSIGNGPSFQMNKSISQVNISKDLIVNLKNSGHPGINSVQSKRNANMRNYQSLKVVVEQFEATSRKNSQDKGRHLFADDDQLQQIVINNNAL